MGLILLLCLDRLNQSFYLFFAFESSWSRDGNVIFFDNSIKWNYCIFGMDHSPPQFCATPDFGSNSFEITPLSLSLPHDYTGVRHK